MDSEPFTHEQKIAKAKTIGWYVSASYGDKSLGYHLYTPEPDIYEPDENEIAWLPVETEADAWAQLPDDPLQWWIERLERRRENYKAFAQEVLVKAIEDAHIDYQRELADIERAYQDALAAIEQVGERK